MKKSQFVSSLKRALAWDQTPKLTEDDIDYLVDLSRAADARGNYVEDVEAWEPATHYEVGQTVVHDHETFICVVSGTSGGVAPDYASDHVGNYVDGTAEWVYSGTTAWTPTYDFNRAAYEGWGLKAAKAASLIGFTSDGARMDRQQYMEHCERMQRKYPILASAKSRRSPRFYPMILEVRVDE
jgi:hypothetical protein